MSLYFGTWVNRQRVAISLKFLLDSLAHEGSPVTPYVVKTCVYCIVHPKGHAFWELGVGCNGGSWSGRSFGDVSFYLVDIAFAVTSVSINERLGNLVVDLGFLAFGLVSPERLDDRLELRLTLIGYFGAVEFEEVVVYYYY